MCFDYDETYDVYRESIVKTRKTHKCYCCGREIAVGELAVSFVGICSDFIDKGHVCGGCEATRFRVHLREVHEGCRGSETWCAYAELLSYCHDTGFRRSTRFVGQLYLTAKRNRERAKPRAIFS